MIVVDDHISDVNQLVADIFTKISHHRNIIVLHLIQNLFHKHKYARTISLNPHYLVLFKNCRDVGQFALLARQMYPTSWKFERAVWLSASRSTAGSRRTMPPQNMCFPGELQHVYVRK